MALVSEDTTVAEIVNATKAGVVIDPKKIEKIKDVLWKMYEQYKKGVLGLGRKDDLIILKYERSNLSGNLAEVFNELT